MRIGYLGSQTAHDRQTYPETVKLNDSVETQGETKAPPDPNTDTPLREMHT